MKNGGPIKKRRRGADDRRTWIDKVDKVFSLYIRLRDSRPWHFMKFRCISCGDVKDFDQMDAGHFVSRNAMAIRWNADNVSGECRRCLTPDALILMEDLTWKPLGEVHIMDKVFSIEEYPDRGRAREYRVGTVTHIRREIQDVYEVALENGDKVKTTAKHKWLARGRGSDPHGYQWIETQNLWIKGKNLKNENKTGPKCQNSATSVVCKIIDVVHQDFSREAGWLAGMIDADGCVCQQNIHDKDGTLRYGFRISVAQCDKYPKICKDVRKLLEKFTDNRKLCRQNMHKWKSLGLGKKQNYNLYQYMVTGTNIEKVMFLQKVRPNKIDKVNIEKLGQIRTRYETRVKSIKYIGKQEIVVMETDTHTFIANGYAMHNCNRMQGDHLLSYRKNLILKLGQKAIEGSAIAAALPNDKRLVLIKKLGEKRVEELEAQKYVEKKWTVEELKELYMYYGALVLELKKSF